MEATAVVL